jgi:predicted nucleic-acid-binding Zn-ribbon protein
MECAKCKGAMTEGFIIDFGHYQTKQQQIWVEGEPESSFWSGLKTSNRPAFHVGAQRCIECGYLEFYTKDSVSI